MSKKWAASPEELHKRYELVTRREQGWTLKALAAFYGLSKQGVWNIIITTKAKTGDQCYRGMPGQATPTTIIGLRRNP